MSRRPETTMRRPPATSLHRTPPSQMKPLPPRHFPLALAAALAGFLPATPLPAQQPAAAPQAKPELGAMILMADGKRQRGFVQDSNERGLLFTLVERSPGTGYAWDTQVKAVAFDEADEIMREARASFAQGQYETAAKQLGTIADIYANVAWVPNSFATEARYYQIESLRLLGRWQEMGPLLQTPAALAIPTRLPEFFQRQFKLNQLWAQLGAGQLEGLKAAVASLEKPVVGQAKLLPSPSLQELPLRELVQITFFRAKLNEAAGNLDQALADYYRTFSLTFGNQKLLSDLSMKSAMAIQARQPAVAEGTSPVALRQMQSLAYLYRNAFSGGEIEAAYEKFAVKPELPKAPAPKKEEGAEAPAGGTPAPAASAGAPAKGAAPASKAGEAPKGAPAPAAPPAANPPAPKGKAKAGAK